MRIACDTPAHSQSTKPRGRPRNTYIRLLLQLIDAVSHQTENRSNPQEDVEKAGEDRLEPFEVPRLSLLRCQLVLTMRGSLVLHVVLGDTLRNRKVDTAYR